MSMIITEISIKNYKSIRKLEKFALGKLNVLLEQMEQVNQTSSPFYEF